MDIEKLIEALRNYSVKDRVLFNLQTVKNAADALTALQIELKAMRGAGGCWGEGKIGDKFYGRSALWAVTVSPQILHGLYLPDLDFWLLALRIHSFYR